MLVIRLARTGKKKQAFFRIVVADKRKAVGAKFVEILGNYNPHAKKLELNEEKLNEYMRNGAQPSNTLAKILKKEGVKLPKWVYINEKNRPAKKVEEPKEEPKVEAVEAETAEAPVETEAESTEETPAEKTETEESEPSETTEVAESEPTEEVKEEAPAVEAEADAAEESK